MIAASSSSVYGANPTLPKHEDPPHRSDEPVRRQQNRHRGIPERLPPQLRPPGPPLRFFNVYGPGQRAHHPYAAVIPKWINATLAGRPLTVHGDGTQTRDFTYVGTAFDVLTDALIRSVIHPTPVNLAFGTRTSLLDLITELESATDTPTTRNHTHPRPADVPHSRADATRLHDLFPTITSTPLRLGLRSTVAWHRNAQT